MSNGEVCCILGVCCPPARVRKTAIEHLVKETCCTEEAAAEAFDWFNDRFDFAPKGTVRPLIEAVAEMARQHPTT